MSPPKKEAPGAWRQSGAGAGQTLGRESSQPSPLAQAEHASGAKLANKPSYLQHPLHADFVFLTDDIRALIEQAKALLTATLYAAMQIDGSAVATSHAIRMQLLARITKRKANSLAHAVLRKAKRQ